MFFPKAKALFFDILFPPLCIGCRAHLADSTRVLCDACTAKLTPRTSLFCAECMRRLPESKKVCHLDMPYLLAAAGTYDDPLVKQLVHCLKYEGMRRAAPVLGDFLIRYLEPLGIDLADFIAIPLPLSSKRLRERGFNQAELLARGVAEHFHLPLVSDALVKHLHTKPQKGLERSARLTNLSGCFSVRDAAAVKGRHILLIDDVSTSGATLSEAAHALKKAGAKKIIGLVAAKAQ